ncbi:putative lipid II flippase FtsW [Patescibacteria group bacterium]|nr:putative lipid II flippase FtsW [Patescibacteria group bacterium]MBU3923214.1 putative lipid II flippase FtsW [Patescibacteria group bacterium]
MRKNKPDKGLIICILSLFILGLIILFSASFVISQENFGNSHHYFLHQLLYGGIIGLILFYIFSKIDYRFWKKISLLVLFISLILLVLLFIPNLGYTHAGAQRWLIIGPLSFQPSEFLKLAFVIYLAAFLTKKEVQKGYTNTFIPFLILMGIIGGLMTLQSDAGTLGLIAIVGLIIYFISGARLHQIAITLGMCAAGFFALIKFFPHRMARFIAFLNPSVDPQGISYQINQALLAIGSGGIFGIGLGRSAQKYNYLPEPMGDSIFAIFAEEMGFAGVLVLIGLFFFLAFKGFRIAKKINNDFGKLLSIGITSWLVVQAMMNICAISGLMPLTGIPLPFVSYGGSALAISLAGAGILVNISKHI